MNKIKALVPYIFAFLCILALLLMLTGCNDASTVNVAQVEQKIGDKNVKRFDSIQVIVLPTGERVLVMSGAEGLGACCLLPPKPSPTVEK